MIVMIINIRNKFVAKNESINSIKQIFVIDIKLKIKILVFFK